MNTYEIKDLVSNLEIQAGTSFDKPGIYKIVNSNNSKMYIGSAKNIKKRITRHFNDLVLNKHCNILLQRSFNKLNSLSHFYVEVLCYFEYIEHIKNIEQFFIDKFNARDNSIGYNLADANFGNVLSTHPNKAAIVDKIRYKTNENIKNMTQEQRNIKYGRCGTRNGRWNPTNWNHCKICGKRIQIKYNHCITCIDRSGKNNSFYGKTHTDNAKALISQKNLGKPCATVKSCVVNDIEYDSLANAAKALGVNVSVVHFRINSKNKKFIGYYYKECPTTIENT